MDKLNELMAAFEDADAEEEITIEEEQGDEPLKAARDR